MDEPATDWYTCAYEGRLEDCKQWFRIGGIESVDCQDESGFAALQWAALSGKLDVCEWLLSLEPPARVDIWSDLSEGKTALMLAASNGHIKVVALLLRHDAKGNQTDLHGQSAAHAAAIRNHASVLHILGASEVSLVSVDHQGRSPLHVAAEVGAFDSVRYLLRYNGRANEMTQNEMRETPLHCAARGGGIGVVKLLLLNGASIYMVNSRGRTALQEAVSMGHQEIVSYLDQVTKNGLWTQLPGATWNKGRQKTILAVCAFLFMAIILWVPMNVPWFASMFLSVPVTLLFKKVSPLLFISHGFESPIPLVFVLTMWWYLLVLIQWYMLSYIHWVWYLWLITSSSIGSAFLYVVITRDPGALPPASIDEVIQAPSEKHFCSYCRSVSVPRSKHCSVCQRCVLRFDHHCPYVGNCVGLHNSGPFLGFLVMATLFAMSILLTLMFILHGYYVSAPATWIGCIYYFMDEPYVYVHNVTLMTVCLLFVSGVTIAQAYNLLHNKTTYEAIVLRRGYVGEDAAAFVWNANMDRGWKQNIRIYFGLDRDSESALSGPSSIL